MDMAAVEPVPADFVCAECEEGYHWDPATSACSQGSAGGTHTKTYVACPVDPTSVDTAATTTAVVDSTAAGFTPATDAHLYGCNVCVSETTAAGATSMWCERCKPGYMSFLGGCFRMTEGEMEMNTELCGQHCAVCRRFNGPNNQIDFKCEECAQGFYRDEQSTS